MATALGLLLGAGMILLLAPALWPRPAGGPDAAHSRPPGRLGVVTAALRQQLLHAGLPRVTIATVVAVSVVVAVAAAALVAALVPVPALSAAAGVSGLALPAAAIVWRARAGRRSTRVVWPDVVDHLVSAVRSGLALPDSVVTLAHSGPPPIREAFADFEHDYRATGNFASCLDTLKDRLADPVADRIIETLRMSREVGGHELPTVLRNLASYLRQDAGVRSEIEARQSWTINAARLGVAAPWIVLVLIATRTEAAGAYSTPLGTIVIFSGLAVSVVAYRLMLAVGRLPAERRWFR